MAVTGTKALEAWARKVTSGYSNINILNMTTSWRSGLAFCAIIHHHHPHLIDYDSLDPDDVFTNNSLAFNVAEQHLGIPSLLGNEEDSSMMFFDIFTLFQILMTWLSVSCWTDCLY